MSVRVIKLGGSLLACHDLPNMLARWSARQLPSPSLWVVGGGALSDQIRVLDRRFRLAPELAHRLAIQAMAINSRVVAAWLPGSIWVDDIDLFVRESAHDATRPGVVNPVSVTAASDPPSRSRRLPPSWSVTSDSIAASVAWAVNAAELVLLKSCLPAAEGGTTRAQAATAGYVDPYFPRSARHVGRVRAVNLRDPQFPEMCLEVDGS